MGDPSAAEPSVIRLRAQRIGLFTASVVSAAAPLHLGAPAVVIVVGCALAVLLGRRFLATDEKYATALLWRTDGAMAKRGSKTFAAAPFGTAPYVNALASLANVM